MRVHRVVVIKRWSWVARIVVATLIGMAIAATCGGCQNQAATYVRSSCVGDGVRGYTTEHGALALWADKTCNKVQVP